MMQNGRLRGIPGAGRLGGGGRGTPMLTGLLADQDRVVLAQQALELILAGKGHRNALHLTTEALVMDQTFADEVDLQLGILQLPDLTVLEGRELGGGFTGCGTGCFRGDRLGCDTHCGMSCSTVHRFRRRDFLE